MGEALTGGILLTMLGVLFFLIGLGAGYLMGGGREFTMEVDKHRRAVEHYRMRSKVLQEQLDAREQVIDKIREAVGG